MDKDSILNTMNESSADTIANEKAVNSIVIKNCIIETNKARIVLTYDEELMKKAGFTFDSDFTIDWE